MLDKILKKSQAFCKRADALPKNKIGVIEWVIFGIVAVFGYIFFCHQDILITAGHSIEYLNGHITDFYSACKQTDGIYAANYLPSTFIIFAIWNIPIKLLGLAPEYLGDWSVALTMWNKLLPTLFFVLSGFLIYKLCLERFGFEKNKAVLTMFLTFTSPMAFFSQIFFCQYDIFTVFFMLLGMYYYFKKKPGVKDYLLFTLFFGIAVTFKYFALVIFAVMLLLRVKNVIKAVILMGISVMPAALEVAFYLLFDRKAFVKSVFDFSALDYASGFVIDLGEVSVNLMYVFLLALIGFAYFTKIKSFDELLGYSMFYSNGVCFAFFGMMLWHPQWVMFAVPFWVIGTVINKNNKVLHYVDALMGVVMIVYIGAQFEVTVDQGLLRYGVLFDKLRYKQPSTFKLSDFFVFNDTTILFSVLAACFLISFIFKHPKFNYKNICENIKDGRFAINIRFLAFSLAFIVGSFACLENFLERPDNVWRRNGGEKQTVVEITDEICARQYAMFEEMIIEQVYAVCDKSENEDGTYNKATIYIDFIDTTTQKTVASTSTKAKNIKDGEHTYTKFTLEEPFEPKQDTLYELRFYTGENEAALIYFEKSPNETASYYRVKQRVYDDCYAVYDGGDVGGRELVLRMTGDACYE